MECSGGDPEAMSLGSNRGRLLSSPSDNWGLDMRAAPFQSQRGDQRRPAVCETASGASWSACLGVRVAPRWSSLFSVSSPMGAGSCLMRRSCRCASSDVPNHSRRVTSARSRGTGSCPGSP